MVVKILSLDKNILDYYNKGIEKDRLGIESNQLEKFRTLDILERYIPKKAKLIVDIGGGAGIYSFILSEQKYEVHLIDATPMHVTQALEINKTHTYPLASITIGDAREIKLDDNYADIILMFGPLYHLTDKKDRIKALSEAYRILKPGGIIFSAGISKFASLMDGFERKFILQEDFQKIVLNDLKTGQHRNPTNHEHYFTTSYFHEPNDLLIEHVEAGFEDLELLAIEGPLGLLGNIGEYLSNEDHLKILLEYSRKIEKETSLIGTSRHFKDIARK